MCNHIIGMLYECGDSRLVTLDDLKQHIHDKNELLSSMSIKSSELTLKHYADRRYATDLFHFKHCPDCGEEIDWLFIRRN